MRKLLKLESITRHHCHAQTRRYTIQTTGDWQKAGFVVQKGCNLLCTTKAPGNNLKDMQENQQSHPVVVRSGVFLNIAFTTQVNLTSKEWYLITVWNIRVGA